MPDHTQRFSALAGDYAKYRPSYPLALFDDLDGLAWTPRATVADIGAGTGLFTRLVADRVALVLAVEPNGPMRAQGVADSQGWDNITWVDGTGEAMGLADASVDALVCAQAFHWLDPAAAAAEWRRILKPGAAVVLVWNERDEEESPLQAEYEELLHRWSPQYPLTNHKNIKPEAIEAFFAPAPMKVLTYRNDQRFDLEGWRGRLRSASYCPAPGQPGRQELMDGLAPLFEKYRDDDGLMTFPYVTKAYLGRLNTRP